MTEGKEDGGRGDGINGKGHSGVEEGNCDSSSQRLTTKLP